MKSCTAHAPTSPQPDTDRSHALRGNVSRDALRHPFQAGRGASQAAFPRGAWERSAALGACQHHSA
ncbi:hypothetical protein PspR76_14395 [Pseudomonas sp. R76]|nr:hypothetical protein PspR76_14395 [Pseudomonas sp. R76]